MTDRAVSGWGSWMGLVLQLVTLLPGYANPLKRLDTSESVNLHKYLILLDSCRIHATRWLVWPADDRSSPTGTDASRPINPLGTSDCGAGWLVDNRSPIGTGASRSVDP